MLCLTMRCEVLPGKEEGFDYLTRQLKEFWAGQPGVKSFHEYRLVGSPVRTIMVEVEDLGALQRMTETGVEHVTPLRKEFLGYVSRAEYEILDVIL